MGTVSNPNPFLPGDATGNQSLASQYNAKALATVSIYDWSGYVAGLTDESQQIQDALFWAQRIGRALKVNNTRDELLNDTPYIQLNIPHRPAITCPIIVPTGVLLNAIAGIAVGTTSGGAVVANYNGVPSAQPLALANSCLPALIFPPLSRWDELTITIEGACSGLAQGKNWVPSAAAVQALGSGYSVNDVLTLPQPDVAPYVATQLTVSSVNGSGGITGVTLTTAGVYSAPGAAQSRYWTQAYGFTGSIAAAALGQVFDGSGNYICSGGTGTGATFSLTWAPDFVADGTDYTMGNTALWCRYRFRTLRVDHASATNSGTYGKSFGYYFLTGSADMMGGQVETYGGYYGIQLRGNDMMFNELNPVKASVLLKVRGSSMTCQNVRLDSYNVCALDMDFTQQCNFKGYIINNSGIASGGTIEPINVGRNMSNIAFANTGLNLCFSVSSFGRAVSTAMAKLAYVRDSIIELHAVNNDQGGTLSSFPFTSMFNVGTGFDKSCILRGNKTTGIKSIMLLGTALPLCSYQITGTPGLSSPLPIRPELATPNPSARAPFNQNTAGTASWKMTTSGAPTLAAGSTGPYGRRNAALWTFGASDNLLRQVTASANTDILVDCIAKAGSATSFTLTLADGSFTNFASVQFNLSTGTVVSVGGSGTRAITAYDIEMLPNGFYRCWAVMNVNAANPRAGISQSPSANGTNIVVHAVRLAVNPTAFPPVWTPFAVTVAASTSAAVCAYCEYEGQIFRVEGVNGSAKFIDLIMVSPGNATVVVITSNTSGAPPARTYAQDIVTNLGAITVALASSTSTVTAQEVGDVF